MLNLQGAAELALNLNLNAINTFNQLVVKDSKNHIGYNNLGVAQKKLRNFNLAARAFKNAIQIKPDYAEAYYNLGNCFSNTKINHAIKSFKTAINLQPNYPDAYLNLGNCHKRLNNQIEAIEAFSNGLNCDPSNYDLSVSLIELLATQKK